MMVLLIQAEQSSLAPAQEKRWRAKDLHPSTLRGARALFLWHALCVLAKPRSRPPQVLAPPQLLCQMPSASFQLLGPRPFRDHLALSFSVPAAFFTYRHLSNHCICRLAALSSHFFQGRDSISFISRIPRSWHTWRNKKNLSSGSYWSLKCIKRPEMYYTTM